MRLRCTRRTNGPNLVCRNLNTGDGFALVCNSRQGQPKRIVPRLVSDRERVRSRLTISAASAFGQHSRRVACVCVLQGFSTVCHGPVVAYTDRTAIGALNSGFVADMGSSARMHIGESTEIAVFRAVSAAQIATCARTESMSLPTWARKAGPRAGAVCPTALRPPRCRAYSVPRIFQPFGALRRTSAREARQWRVHVIPYN